VTLSDSSFFAMDPAYHRPADRIERLDAGRLDAWTHAVAATVRRLDGLAGQPAPDDDYLVLARRVWSRWVLAGTGLALAALLVARHRSSRSWYFPVLLAAACLIAPALALPLLAPAALLAFVRPGRPAGFRGGCRAVWTFLGALPLLLYLLLLAGAWGFGLSAWESGYRESWTGAALVLGALGAWALAPTPRAPAAAAAPPDLPAS